MLYNTTMDHENSPIRSASFDQIRNLSKALRLFQEQATKPCGITFTQFVILDFVCQKSPLYLKDLHQQLGVKKSTTSRLIKPLIEKNYLEKKANSLDKRVFELYLTEAGEGLYRAAWNSFSEAIDRFFSAVPVSEQLRIAGSMQVISEAFFSSCRH